MGGPNYAADHKKYGASDARIRAAKGDPKKLSEAAKLHPDRASIKKTITEVNA